MTTIVSDRTVIPAADLVIGDRIAATFLPLGREAEVEGAFPYEINGNAWVLLVYRTPDGYPFAEAFHGNVNVPVTRLGDRCGRTTAVAHPKPDTLLEPLGRACDPAYTPGTDTT